MELNLYAKIQSFLRCWLERKRVRWPVAFNGWFNVLQKCNKPLLRIVPAFFIKDNICLDDRRFVAQRLKIRIPVVIDIGRGKGAPGAGGKPFRIKFPGSPLG